MNARRFLKQWLSGTVGWARLVLLLIAGGGLLAIGVAFIDDRIVAYQRSHYVKARCYMESSQIFEELGRDDRNYPGWNYVPVVTYRYQFGGQNYASNVVSSHETPLATRAARDDFLRRFGPGADAECYVDPSDPTEAMLELPTNEQAVRVAKLGGCALLIAVAGLVALQMMLTMDTAPRRRRPRAPGWGEIDSGPNDALARTRQILKERLES